MNSFFTEGVNQIQLWREETLMLRQWHRAQRVFAAQIFPLPHPLSSLPVI